MKPRVNLAVQILLILPALLAFLAVANSSRCGERSGKQLRYVRGDALEDDADCVGPDGRPYPIEEINALLPKIDTRHKLFTKPRRANNRNSRQPRLLSSDGDDHVDAELVRRKLLSSVSGAQNLASIDEVFAAEREGRSKRYKRDDDDDDDSDADVTDKEDDMCKPDPKTTTPSRMCQTTFNTTAPMYGVSLTNGKPVTIVQKFPDLLQQVVFETCSRSECDIMHGECVQTYVPYLFLVIPLGPVTLTGQDYVLVESGCTCRPKYALPNSDPDPLSILPQF